MFVLMCSTFQILLITQTFKLLTRFLDFLQDKRNLQGTHNAARRFIDGLQYVTDSIASVSAKPTKAVSMWLTDQIAPPYWVPNAQITVRITGICLWFGLCCLMTPGLSKDIRCHV